MGDATRQNVRPLRDEFATGTGLRVVVSQGWPTNRPVYPRSPSRDFTACVYIVGVYIACVQCLPFHHEYTAGSCLHHSFQGEGLVGVHCDELKRLIYAYVYGGEWQRYIKRQKDEMNQLASECHDKQKQLHKLQLKFKQDSMEFSQTGAYWVIQLLQSISSVFYVAMVLIFSP